MSTEQAKPAPAVEFMRTKHNVFYHLVRFSRSKPLGLVGAMIALVMLIVAITAPIIVPHDPYDLRVEHTLEAPNSTFWLGTDNMGRDQMSRIILGARVSLYVAMLSSIMGAGLGGVLGIIAAYKGGALDNGIMRVMDVMMAFPMLALALAMVAALGPSLNNCVIAVAIPFVPRVGRTIRSQALSVKETQYIDAARAIGCSDRRIIFSHMMPNCLAPWLVVTTIYLGTAILTEASLSFLGLGVPPPEPSWGNMLTGAAGMYTEQAAWMAIFPGLAITITVFGFNMFGDALRDLWDPKLRGR